MTLWEAVQKVACTICQTAKAKVKPPDPKPLISVSTLGKEAVRTLVHEADIKILYGMLDKKYYYTTFEDWGKVFEYIYMVEDIPPYLTQRWDCEDFALWLKAMVSFHFGLNLFAVIIGDVPAGRHGFNMFYCEDGWYLWEPQWVYEGEPFRIGDRDYKPLFALL